MTSFAWTDEQIGMLTRLRADGLSAAQIAAKIGGGFSRSAVLGKIARLGLASPVRAAAKSRSRLPPRTPKIDTANGIEIDGFDGAPAREDLEIPVEQRRSLLGPPFGVYPERRPGECAYPIGDPKEDPANFFFCGAPRYGALPYCAHHARCAYTVPERRTRAQEPFRRTA